MLAGLPCKRWLASRRHQGGFQMNNVLGLVLAIVATILLLFLREFILSIGKKSRNPYGARDHQPGVFGSDVEREQRLHAVPIRRLDQPIAGATPIEIDQFLTELRAKAQEQSPPSRDKRSSTVDLGGLSHRRPASKPGPLSCSVHCMARDSPTEKGR